MGKLSDVHKKTIAFLCYLYIEDKPLKTLFEVEISAGNDAATATAAAAATATTTTTTKVEGTDAKMKPGLVGTSAGDRAQDRLWDSYGIAVG